MELVTILLVAAVVFGLCFLIDKGFNKIFRNKAQHTSGLSVRLNKRYGSIGLIVFVIGIAAVFTGLSDGWVLIAGGAVLMITGAALVTYYMTFGIYYDEDGFVLTTFGKRSKTYAYKEICSQQLYMTAGNVIIELHMADGRAVQLQSAMTGVYSFLDAAFEAWLLQTGRNKEECDFYNPENSCWFPTMEG